MRSAPSPSARLLVEALEDRLAPAVFTVTSPNDAGAGTLRAAISSANALPGPDSIRFHIAGNGVHSIELLSALPMVTGPLKFAGRTQPGYAGNPLIELNGVGAGPDANGLVIAPSASGSVIRALAINRFQNDGIRISADDCVVASCRIGTNAAGTFALSRGNETGIRITNGASGNIIGGAGRMAANVISGNTTGLHLEGEGTTGNLVFGNLIGTDVSGRFDLGNIENGILIGSGASENRIGAAGSRNIISGNNGVGVIITGAGTAGNKLKGNFIGTDGSGSIDLGNSLHGILVADGAEGTVIGGFTAVARNVISGNDKEGILISSASNNAVRGNLIGTDRTGTGDLGNSGRGIVLNHQAAGNIIGGTVGGAGNVISGNGESGVWLQDFGTTGNRIQGNRIGVGARSLAAIGNEHYGLFIGLGACNNLVGGAQPGAGNIIAHSGMHGVALGAGTGNAILKNRIFANEFLGIDLDADGITTNDVDDLDNGANNRLNFPELSTARLAPSGLRVSGSINTQLDEVLRIEFFATPSLDDGGHGEGQRYLGFVLVPSTQGSTVSFSVLLPSLAVPTGQYITATATDFYGNTSEFSLGLRLE